MAVTPYTSFPGVNQLISQLKAAYIEMRRSVQSWATFQGVHPCPFPFQGPQQDLSNCSSHELCGRPLVFIQNCPLQKQPSELDRPLGGVPHTHIAQLALTDYAGSRTRTSIRSFQISKYFQDQNITAIYMNKFIGFMQQASKLRHLGIVRSRRPEIPSASPPCAVPLVFNTTSSEVNLRVPECGL